MPDEISMRVRSVPDFAKIMRTGRLGIREILTQLSVRAVTQLRKYAPVRTGRLKGSATWFWTKQGGAFSYNYSAARTGESFTGHLYGKKRRGEIIFIAGTGVYYAKFVEWGTRYMAPRGYAAAAAREVRARVQAAVRRGRIFKTSQAVGRR